MFRNNVILRVLVAFLCAVIYCIPVYAAGEKGPFATALPILGFFLISYLLFVMRTKSNESGARKMAEQGNVLAQYEYGCILFGNGKRKEAMELFRKAADQGHAIAQCKFAYALQQGDIVQKDDEEAIKLYLKAAKQGYIWGQLEIGKALCYGQFGIIKNLDEGKKLLNLTSLQGDTESYYHLNVVLMMEKGDIKSEKDFLNFHFAAAQQGYAESQYFYALALWYSMEDDINAKKEALKWIRKAAEQGYADAQYFLADLLSTGNEVIQLTKNELQANEWFQKAAEQGHATAEESWAWVLKEKGAEQSKVEAVKWFRKAAEQGVINAKNCVGTALKNGEGVEQNKKEALEWFLEAAEQGNKYAQYNYANALYNGEGIDKDEARATEWYYKAALLGHEESIKIIIDKKMLIAPKGA